MTSHFEQVCSQVRQLFVKPSLTSKQEAVKLIYTELLRDYQKEGIQALDDYLESGTKRLLRQAFTGTGKSVEQLYLAMRHIAQSPQNKVLFLVPTDELITNLAEYLLSNGVSVSYIKAGRQMLNSCQVHIASVATLVKRLDSIPFSPTLILADECFPAGTLVDGKPIEEYKIGDYVWSWDETTGQKEKKKVTHIFKHKTDSIVNLSFRNGVYIRCTINHPFYVFGKGWVDAARLRCCDGVLVHKDKHQGSTTLTNITHTHEPNTSVYNLEVEDYHTYFAEGVLVHNCHHSAAATWTKCLNHWQDIPKIGFSATPERLDGKPFTTLFDVIVQGKPYKWYVENGYLSPFKKIEPKQVAEMRFKITKGDYDQQEQEEFFRDTKILGDAVEQWEKFCLGLKTITFCPGIDTSKNIVNAYNEFGMRHYGRAIAEHLDGKTPTAYRKEVFKRFKLPLAHDESLLIMSNVALFIEGISVPSCHVTQCLRKTKSATLWDQMIGRSNRYEPGKIQYILDHVGNLYEHGDPDRERFYDLIGRKKREKTAKYALICDKCTHQLTTDYRKLSKQLLAREWLPCPDCSNPVFIPKASKSAVRGERKEIEIDDSHDLVLVESNDEDARLFNLNVIFRKVNARYSYQSAINDKKFLEAVAKYQSITLADLKLACRFRDMSESHAMALWYKKLQASANSMK